MTFRQFAFNNVLRNKRLYAAYFLSSLFTVMVFFTFSIFAYHPMLSGENVHGSAATALSSSKWIIYVFSFFFVLYSMSTFLQSRKREFGLLMLQGMSDGQLRRMVFLENMLIGLAASAGGIGLGLIFAKAILLLGENILQLGGNLPFYIPWQAITVTLISFLILFVLISLFIAMVLRSGKLIQLIKSNKISKGEPKASLLLSLLVVALIGISYTLSLNAKGVEVVLLLVPVVIMVCIATYLFFTQLSVYLIRKLKSKEHIFWKKTNMLLFSDLSYRMKDNARTFFLVAIISTVAFCSIGSLYGFRTVLTKPLIEINPYIFHYVSKQGDTEQQMHLQLIESTLQRDQIQATRGDVQLNYYEIEGQKQPILMISLSEYNRFAGLMQADPIELAGNAPILVGADYGFAVSKDSELLSKPLITSSKLTLRAEQKVTSHLLPGSLHYLIVPDHIESQLGNPAEQEHYYAWNGRAGQPGAIAAGKALLGTLEQYGDQYQFLPRDYQLDDTIKGYAPILFIGLFIGIVFFVSAGSFLYFRLYSDLDEDKEKFKAIAKLGLSKQELSHVLTQQISLLFFTPIVIALVHGAVALTALSNMFEYSLFWESASVLGIFCLIQFVYFVIVRYFYIRQVQSVM